MAKLATSLARVAASEGQTPREFLQYVYQRVFREPIADKRVNHEISLTLHDPAYLPPFIKLWLEGTHRMSQRGKLNGHESLTPALLLSKHP